MPQSGWLVQPVSKVELVSVFQGKSNTAALFLLGFLWHSAVHTSRPPLLLACHLCFQSPLTSLSTEIPQGLALGFWLPFGRGFWNSTKPDLTANIYIRDRRKIKCFLYARETCGCSFKYLTKQSPALMDSPIPYLSSCPVWNMFRGELTAFLGVDANLLLTSGGNSAFSFSSSPH